MRGGCGIPYIELMGKVEDWELLKTKTESLREFSIPNDNYLDKWLNQLTQVLDHFISASQGKPDLSFWGSVCNLSQGSGVKGNPVTGWIQVFFPYLNKTFNNKPVSNLSMVNWMKAFEECKKIGVNKALQNSMTKQKSWEDQFIAGVPLNDLPSGLSKASVQMKWLNDNSEQELLFYGGLVATYQHLDGALEIRSGWGVVEERK